MNASNCLVISIETLGRLGLVVAMIAHRCL